MNDINLIASWIELNAPNIIDRLKLEDVDVYTFLNKEFNSSDVSKNYLFQFVYRSFYRLDNAGLTDSFKTEYFKLMQECRLLDDFDFLLVLNKLDEFETLRKRKSFQFSFVTKMANTINNSIPIYDSFVAKMFSFSRQEGETVTIRLNKYLEQLKTIQDDYKKILDKKLLTETLQKFDEKFINNNLPDIKKLDFIFWSAGKLKAM